MSNVYNTYLNNYIMASLGGKKKSIAIFTLFFLMSNVYITLLKNYIAYSLKDK